MNLRVLARNALANVMSGAAMALVSLVMPYLLLRRLPAETFGVWALVLQVAAYVNVLSFNMQTVVGRFLALELAAGRFDRARRFVSSAACLLGICGAVAMLFAVAGWFFFDRVFGEVRAPLAAQASIALLLMGAALSIALPGAALNGVFAGLQRSEVNAAITVVSRLVLVVAVVAVAGITQHLVWMGLAFALVNILTILGTAWRVSKVTPRLTISPAMVGKEEIRQLFDYSYSLAIWSISMLLVTGLNTAIVGIFDYPSLAAFAVAASIVAFLVGIQQSIFAVLIPAAAQRIGQADPDFQLDKLLLRTTRYGCILMGIVGFPLLIWAKPILTLLAGPELAEVGTPILRVLILGNMLRLSAVPFVNLAIAAGEQRRMLVTPLIEGLVNLLVSIWLCQHIGALGVAVGTLVGAFFGVGGNLVVNMSKASSLHVKLGEYLGQGLIRPYLCFLPAMLALLFESQCSQPLQLAAIGASFLLAGVFALNADERHYFGRVLRISRLNSFKVV